MEFDTVHQPTTTDQTANVTTLGKMQTLTDPRYHVDIIEQSLLLFTSGDKQLDIYRVV